MGQMLNQIMGAYRAEIAKGKTPSEASRAVAEVYVEDEELLPVAWSELAIAALPVIGQIVRSPVTLSSGTPWYEQAEWRSWTKIPVPIGHGRRLPAGTLTPVEMRPIGTVTLRAGRSLVKLGNAILEACDKAKGSRETLVDILPRLSKEKQDTIGEWVLQHRRALEG